MTANTPTLRTGRLTTFIASLLAVLMMAFLGVTQFTELSTGMTLTVLESLALVFGGAALLTEIFFEGDRTGILNRTDYTGLDFFGAISGLTVFTVGLVGLVGAAAGSTLIPMPASAKGLVFLFNTALLTRELFTA